jgi:Acetyltransferase (GNAT) domain
MGRFCIEQFSDDHAAEWDAFVPLCPMATFLQTRRYISYHGDRFHDLSILLRDEKNALIGISPAAIDPSDTSRVVSHPGITYGGMLHNGGLRGQNMLDAFDSVKAHYRAAGLQVWRYKPVPAIYHAAPSADDLYACFRLGAKRWRCDLSCAVDLDHRLPVSSRRKRGMKNAGAVGVTVSEDNGRTRELWPVLEENLRLKHNLKPVHTIDEIESLQSRFPKNIRTVVAQIGHEVVAGTVLFATARVLHAQYIASSEKGQEASALDAVFEFCLIAAQSEQRRYFNFGVSTEKDGQHLNAGLHQFKYEFGGGGVLHEWYDIDLTA